MKSAESDITLLKWPLLKLREEALEEIGPVIPYHS